MKTNLITSGLLLLAGALFLVAAPQYGAIAYHAPSSPNSWTALEFSSGLPAVAFTIAGVAGIIGGIAKLICDHN